MRYLNVTAQDVSGQSKAETVHFQFYEGEILHREVMVTAIDTAPPLLTKFAKAYLKLAWFNGGNGRARYLQIFAQNASGDGTPEAVRLNFHDEAGPPIGSTIAYKASAVDLDNDGRFELILSSDVDNDGHADRKDRRRVQSLALEFLKLDWH